MRWSLLPLALVGLAGCAGSLEGLRQAAPQGAPFERALAGQYLAVADARAAHGDWLDAEHFARKGQVAAQGRPVAPERPEGWRRIAAADRAALAADRERLVALLDGGGRERQPEIAARAQGSYDCWVEQAQAGAEAACRRRFEAAMAQLEVALRPVRAQARR